ncbi:MAG: DUF998 domain-containing protein [Nitrososphaerota archaeon]
MPRYGLLSGLLIAIGVTQFMIFMIVCEALYPGYNVAHNYISDLGVGLTAPIFNNSIEFLGILVVISSILLYREYKSRLLSILLFLTGFGATGVGVFPEGSPYELHTIMSATTFIFAGISAIAVYRFTPKPISLISVVLGIISLTALSLFAFGIYLGLGHGGMERMIVYPVFSWALLFAGHIITRGTK